MIQYLFSGGIFMIPILISFVFLVFISLKNIYNSYHTDKIILIGSFSAIFGITSTAVGISNALNIAPDISKVAPNILWYGLKNSLVTTFSGGFVLFLSTFLWYYFSIKYKLKTV